MAAMSIQAMKGVEIGMGFESARRYGSEVHDDIYFDQAAGQFIRKSNNAGGLEGGITNGQSIIVRVAMKPIATLYTPKDAYEMANALIEKFGGDTLEEMKRNFEAYQEYVRSF
jgi:chorismate synthase